jgi:hypothetical protein
MVKNNLGVLHFGTRPKSAVEMLKAIHKHKVNQFTYITDGEKVHHYLTTDQIETMVRRNEEYEKKANRTK